MKRAFNIGHAVCLVLAIAMVLSDAIAHAAGVIGLAVIFKLNAMEIE